MNKPNNTESKSSPSLKLVAKNLQENKYKNVVFMVGAGISTAAGIPDFRSPGTGLYDNLEKLNLPFPEAVFEIDFFKKNPVPFYTLAKELYPGQFEPTDFHRFMKWVEDQGMLKRVYTQNIDTLERIVGISSDKIVEAHGSFAGNTCVECKHVPPANYVSDLVLTQAPQERGVKIPKCPECGSLVKPDIVFFGEGLPDRFFELMEKDFEEEVDLVICAGTSLQVHPFAQLPDMVDPSCDRVLLNAEKVGSFGRRKRDVVVKCQLDDINEMFPFINEIKDLVKKDNDRLEANQAEEAAVLTKESKQADDQVEKDLAAELEQLELGSTEPTGPTESTGSDLDSLSGDSSDSNQ